MKLMPMLKVVGVLLFASGICLAAAPAIQRDGVDWNLPFEVRPAIDERL